MRERTKNLDDLPGADLPIDLAEGILAAVVVIVALVFMVFIGVPFLIALGELLLIVLLALVGAIGRVLFRRPWTIDAVGPDGARHEWRVVGWKASSAARGFVSERVAATGAPPTTAEVAAATLTG